MESIYSDYYPIFLYVDKYHFSRNWYYPETTVPYSLIRYMISGAAIFSIDGKKYDIEPDDVFYIPQGCRLGGSAKEECVFISIRFVDSLQVGDADMLQTLWNIPTIYNFAGNPSMKSYFEEAYISALSRNTFKMLQIRGYLNLICAQMAAVRKENCDKDPTLEEDRRQMEKMEARFDMQSIRHRAEKSARAKNDPRIAIVLDTIISDPGGNYTSRELSEIAGVSESTLRRLFKEQTGKTLYDFIKENKMNSAARKLLITNDSITDIAYSMGYESPSYFTKRFKEVFGVSPQEYRKSSHGV